MNAPNVSQGWSLCSCRILFQQFFSRLALNSIKFNVMSSILRQNVIKEQEGVGVQKRQRERRE